MTGIAGSRASWEKIMSLGTQFDSVDSTLAVLRAGRDAVERSMFMTFLINDVYSFQSIT